MRDFIFSLLYVQQNVIQMTHPTIIAIVKKWTNLPKNASDEILYLPYKKRGANCFHLGHLHDICSITKAATMLNSNDPLIDSLSKKLVTKIVVRNVDDVVYNFLDSL